MSLQKGVIIKANAPTVNDDNTKGFYNGFRWINSSTTPATIYTCTNNATGAAVWIPELRVSNSSTYSSPTRNFGVNYTPNTLRPTLVLVTFLLSYSNGNASNVDILVNGTQVARASASSAILIAGILTMSETVTFIVPPNQTYRFNNTAGGGTEAISFIRELTL